MDRSVQRKRAASRVVLAGCGGLFAASALVLAGYLAWANGPLPDPGAAEARAAGTPAAAELTILLSQLGDAPEEPDLETVRRAVQENEARLRHLHELLDEALVFSETDPFELDPEQRPAMWLGVEGRLARYEGRHGDAMERVLDIIEFSGRTATLASYDTALMDAEHVVAAAEKWCRKLTAPEAAAAGRRLEKVIERFPPAAELARRARALALRRLRPWLQDPQNLIDSVDGLRMGWGAAESIKRPLIGTFYPRPLVAAQVAAFHHAILRESPKPFPARTVVRLPQGEVAREYLGQDWDRGLPLAESLTVLRLLRLELALHAHQLRYGRLPVSLKELRPEVSAASLVDPLSNQAFRYRPSASTGRHPYLLYSVGGDGKDGGGRRCDLIPWYGTPGTDLVAGELTFD